MSMHLETDKLLERFGFSSFLPGQREVIDALTTSGRALAVFPTGGGKSICYQLPALALPGVSIVISPLIALMKDQIDFLKRRGIAAGRLDSSLSRTEAREVNDAIADGSLKLLYVAPERFQNERFLQLLERAKVSLFAIDEAHCISEWGHNFRPDYLKLAEVVRTLDPPNVLALTATATPGVARDICSAFAIPDACAIVTGFYRPNLSLGVHPTTAQDRDPALAERLRSRPPGPAIVYVTLQKTAEAVAEMLRRAGLQAEAYHAGMDAEQRAQVQERWMSSERGIVVATIAFGMGIDKANVRYVYHYNLPKSLESYSQEIGRAGRDGKPSVVELLACPDDVPTLENFAYGDTPTEKALRGLLEDVLLETEHVTFDIATTELADRHDMRILVVRTALTYLELLRVLKQNAPFYASYKLRPERPVDEIVAAFQGEHAAFVRDVFRYSTKGRTWFTVDPEHVATAMSQDRARVVRALEVLQEQGHAELTASDLRHRYTHLLPAADRSRELPRLLEDLLGRFQRREDQEIARLGQVVSFLGTATCHTNALVKHFGEERGAPCGHCTACDVGRSTKLPAERPPPPIPDDLADTIERLRAQHPAALAEPRQVARFLCGLSSPALTRAKLSRHGRFGALEHRRFADVLAWCVGTHSRTRDS